MLLESDRFMHTKGVETIRNSIDQDLVGSLSLLASMCWNKEGKPTSK